MLKETGQAPYSVLPLHNIYGTLISLEVLMYKHDSILRYKPPGGVC